MTPTDDADALVIENENHDPILYALDPVDGALIAEIALPGNATGSPMTYLHEGEQTLVLPIGGGRLPAELVALRLPRGIERDTGPEQRPAATVIASMRRRKAWTVEPIVPERSRSMPSSAPCTSREAIMRSSVVWRTRSWRTVIASSG